MSRGELAFGGARAHRAAQVELALVEEAPAQVSVGGDAQARAGGAERLAHRRDDPDLAAQGVAAVRDRAVDYICAVPAPS